MQNENDDIDGLFRRAAEDYPLKTSDSNWEKVSQMLDKEKPSQAPLFIRFGKLSSLIVLVIILTGLGFAVGYFMNHTTSGSIINNPNAQQTISKAPSSNHIDNNSTPSIVLNHSSNNKIPDPAATLPVSKQLLSDDHLNTHTPILTNNNKALTNAQIINKRKLVSRSKTNMNITAPVLENVIDNSSIVSPDQSVKISTVERFIIDQPELSSPTLYPISLADTLAVLENINKLNLSDLVTAQTIDHKLTPKESKFYTSLLAGPDFSNIKSQSFTKTGFTIGILVGMKINRFSVESGILWDKKYYYSNGKYFNPKSTFNTLRYEPITDLNGLCEMIELPLNISYTLNKNKTNSFLAKMGVSSYLMKKESYDYNYLYYGTSYQGNAVYKNSSNKFLAVLNLGILYNYKINRNISIGIEPYYKIPLSTVGFGRMPISSTGMFAVFTKRF